MHIDFTPGQLVLVNYLLGVITGLELAVIVPILYCSFGG